ncbi:MAG: barstar family protein [Butyricicoccaceae bacterium]
MERYMNLIAIDTEEQFYQKLKAISARPAAHNLDAVYDILTELPQLTICVSRDAAERIFGHKAEAFLGMLADAQEDNQGLKVQLSAE